MGDDLKSEGGLMRWLTMRVVSSFKAKPEQGEAMGNNEASVAAINQFLGDEECQRLLVYAAPELTAVRCACIPSPAYPPSYQPRTPQTPRVAAARFRWLGGFWFGRRLFVASASRLRSPLFDCSHVVRIIVSFAGGGGQLTCV
jgi:hypothetical protein